MNSVQPLDATKITPWDPWNDAWHHIGEQAVQAFFVLSAFLLSWRFLQDWHRVKEARRKNPALSYIWECYEVVKYFIRRFFRIYPSYFVCVLLISYSPFLQDLYEWKGQKLFWQHVYLNKSTHNLWTVPVECSYYLVLPLVVGVYYSSTRFAQGTKSKPVFWILKGALLTATAAMFAGLCYISVWERATYERRLWFYEAGFMIPEYMIVFVSGTVGGILLWELQHAGIYLKTIRGLPKQFDLPGKRLAVPQPLSPEYLESGTKELTTEPLLEKRDGDNIRRLQDRKLVPPWITFAIRTFLDGLCYVLLCLITLLDAFRLPHYGNLLPWLPRLKESELVLGGLFSLLILSALYSEKSFSRLFYWNFAQFAGKVSFSLYLWHPVLIEIVFNRLWGENAVGYILVSRDNVTNNFFDLFVYTMSSSLVVATIAYYLV
ncbi:hypothetical protein HDU91_002848, partial [Kappamyces sp. JEL0680]